MDAILVFLLYAPGAGRPVREKRSAFMEHLVILLIQFILYLDTLSLKTLRQAVPALDRLLANPRATLAEGDITIGPARRYATAIALGLLLSLVGWAVGAPLFFAFIAPARKGPLPAGQVALLWTLGLGLVLGSILLMLRVWRGGQVMLGVNGVEFRYRSTVVTCPWALFSVAGQPFRPARTQFLLPVLPAAVPFVEAQRHGSILGQGKEVNTRAVAFKSPHQATFRALYEVDALELGAFLLRLGQMLGAQLPDGSVPAVEPVLEGDSSSQTLAETDDGWITVRLTHVTFPPFCCACGTSTGDLQEFTGHSSLLRIGRWTILEGTEHVRVWIPVCPTCQNQSWRRYWRAVFRWAGLGVGVPLACGLIVSLPMRNPVWFFVSIPIAMLGLLIGGLIGREVGKGRGSPAQLRRYSSRNGTVCMRFHKPEYAALLLEMMQAPHESWRDPSAPGIRAGGLH